MGSLSNHIQAVRHNTDSIVYLGKCVLAEGKLRNFNYYQVGKVSTNFAAAKNGKVGSNFSAAKNGQVSSNSKKR